MPSKLSDQARALANDLVTRLTLRYVRNFSTSPCKLSQSVITSARRCGTGRLPSRESDGKETKKSQGAEAEIKREGEEENKLARTKPTCLSQPV
ncbi:hypothetical protein ALC57_08317 [Trachymyrmex cornetzi]|uniref:Uncharacterized protein n=1 Tax=Trachymyrmex cornetzi TaxID=471704 RepID=A0A151J7C3_9HYME|nr:hypothetical protein ALC57_08317 [Trachymyrmex cornetzi]